MYPCALPCRFLVFPSIGQPLQTVIDEGAGSLSEKAVLQLALRLVSVLLNGLNLRFFGITLAMPFYETAQYIGCVFVL